MSQHPPCPVVPDGEPAQLVDGRLEHPYRGSNGKRYLYITDGVTGVWSEAPCTIAPGDVPMAED